MHSIINYVKRKETIAYQLQNSKENYILSCQASLSCLSKPLNIDIPRVPWLSHPWSSSYFNHPIYDDNPHGRNISKGVKQIYSAVQELYISYNSVDVQKQIWLLSVTHKTFQKLALPSNPTGDFDWYRAAGRLPNSVKYVTPNIAGFSAGAMYGFGGVAGSVGTGNSSSFAVDYARGNFGFDAAYT